jgi:transposase
MVHAACWAHSRRKVFEALKLNPDDRVARQLVERIDGLFLIDAEACDAGMECAGRHALRNERSRPLLAIIKNEMESTQRSTLPAGALGKAIGYTLSLWHKLTRFLEYPELELSNNLAENSMRGVVLGRKNWIHVGSEQAGPGWLPFCLLSKAAAASGCRFANTWLPSCPASRISPSSTSTN